MRIAILCKHTHTLPNTTCANTWRMRWYRWMLFILMCIVQKKKKVHCLVLFRAWSLISLFRQHRIVALVSESVAIFFFLCACFWCRSWCCLLVVSTFSDSVCGLSQIVKAYTKSKWQYPWVCMFLLLFFFVYKCLNDNKRPKGKWTKCEKICANESVHTTRTTTTTTIKEKMRGKVTQK